MFLCSMMGHMEMYGKIIEQGREGKLNEYLLFQNTKLEDQTLKIDTHHLETNHQ